MEKNKAIYIFILILINWSLAWLQTDINSDIQGHILLKTYLKNLYIIISYVCIVTRLLFQYDDYDPTDIPADQAAPAPAEYLPAGRRGRNLRNRKEKMKMPGHRMMNTKRAKTGMNQRKPKAFRSSARRFSGRALSLATTEAKRQGRQIMSVSEWLRRG